MLHFMKKLQFQLNTHDSVVWKLLTWVAAGVEVSSDFMQLVLSQYLPKNLCTDSETTPRQKSKTSREVMD